MSITINTKKMIIIFFDDNKIKKKVRKTIKNLSKVVLAVLVRK